MLRAIAVAEGRRITAAPDIPTVAEAGVAGFEAAPLESVDPGGVIARAKKRNARVGQSESRIDDESAAFHDAVRRGYLALAVQASLLARHAPPFVFEAFCASRLGADAGGAFGMLAPNAPFDALIARAERVLPGLMGPPGRWRNR